MTPYLIHWTLPMAQAPFLQVRLDRESTWLCLN